MKLMSKFMDEPKEKGTPVSVTVEQSASPITKAKSVFDQPAVSGTDGGRPASPVKFGPRPPPEPLKNALQAPIDFKPSAASSRPLPSVPSPGPGSPTPNPSPMRSPTKAHMEISAFLSEFFGPERSRRDFKVDTAEILGRRPPTPQRVKTLKSQRFQFSGDGKKQPVPAHYERVLFEREMYLCSHTFTNEAGKKVTEVYFWVGDEVPEATVEDANVFLQREARAMGGKLIKLRQGKETAEFLQAFGGIAIIRRGSSNKYDSLAPNMLCGRRYAGQFTFDEVNLSPSCLCSGFPFLITQQGKCYLWKGRGSTVDELSCARLVGMDLALTGELIEIEDGAEPADFWNIFDGGHKSHSADHWRLKPSYDKYCGRLFCSDSAAREQVSRGHFRTRRTSSSERMLTCHF